MTEKTTIHHPEDITRFVRKIGTSEAYQQAQNTLQDSQERPEVRRKIAVGLAATALKGEVANDHLSLEGHAMNITSHLTHFIDDFDEFNHLKDTGASHEEKDVYLERIIEFNHALAAMIEDNPQLKFQEVLTFLKIMNEKINGESTTRRFSAEATTILVGISHEIGFDQIADKIPNVKVRSGTVKDDLRGRDRFVTVGTAKPIGVDVKATYRKAMEYRSKHHHGAIWSYIEPEDFLPNFRISDEDAAKKAPLLLADLQGILNNREQAWAAANARRQSSRVA